MIHSCYIEYGSGSDWGVGGVSLVVVKMGKEFESALRKPRGVLVRFFGGWGGGYGGWMFDVSFSWGWRLSV